MKKSILFWSVIVGVLFLAARGLLSLFGFAAALAALLVFLLGRSRKGRKWGFWLAVAAFLLALICAVSAASQRAQYHSADTAVVMRPVVSVKSAPSGVDAKDLFILHEGTCVKLTDEVGAWYCVRLSDGREGWMKKDCVEVI